MAGGVAGHTPSGRRTVVTGRAPLRNGHQHDNNGTTHPQARTLSIRRQFRSRIRCARRSRHGPRPGLRPRPSPLGGEHVGRRLRRSARPHRQPLQVVRRLLEFRRPDLSPRFGAGRRLLASLPRGQSRDRCDAAGRAHRARRSSLEGISAGRGLGAASRFALASAAAVVTALAVFSSAMVMANIQGATAPFSSLLSMLPVHAPHGELADTLHQVRQHLADYPNTGDRTPPALEVMVSDFSRYHAVIAVAATTVAVVLIGMSAVSWRRSARTGASDRRTRRVFRSFGLVSALLSLVVIVVAVANTTTTADPAPALLAFFEGGW